MNYVGAAVLGERGAALLDELGAALLDELGDELGAAWLDSTCGIQSLS